MRIVYLGLVVCLGAPLVGCDTDTAPTQAAPLIRRVNPPALVPPTGWSHVVVATGGRTVYIAGQTGRDKDGNVAPGFREQGVPVFENLKSALAAEGLGFEDVARLNYYLVDMANAPIMREVRGAYIGSEFPASSLVEVRRLARDDLQFELEAVAVGPLE